MELLEAIRATEKANREKFERETVAFQMDGVSVTMAEARAVFEKYHPGDDWKRPVDARCVPYADIYKFAKAVQFYHGGTICMIVPESSGSGVERGYHVTNSGYAC